ncbi:unnamed protein product, partial [Mesorhabditis belari]|uniref:Uncharacterized protein n=1 Tax=Mesorhabditis belari TaxID=2138241 RepID=A0AAF3EF04_9BILA
MIAFKTTTLLFFFTTFFSSVIGQDPECVGVECGFGVMANAAYAFIAEVNAEYGIVVVNNCSNSIYLKCASGDDAITGDGSDDDDWWTLENGMALAWGFHSGFNTCFWCYANNNGQEARDSGNWYIHQNVWGSPASGCSGAPDTASQGNHNGVTSWQIRDDGAYSNGCAACGEDDDFELYTEWGPDPNA